MQKEFRLKLFGNDMVDFNIATSRCAGDEQLMRGIVFAPIFRQLHSFPDQVRILHGNFNCFRLHGWHTEQWIECFAGKQLAPFPLVEKSEPDVVI